MTVYALYKGNDLLSIGTAKEIAKEMNVSVATVYFYQTPSCAKRSNGGNKRVLIKLEDE